MECPVCNSKMRQSSIAWLHHCTACNFYGSDLWNSQVFEKNESTLDEQFRIKAIQKLRKSTAQNTLGFINDLRKIESMKICDVGCGYGWFLECVKEFNGSAIGIEPEQQIAEIARASGLEIVIGRFPECLDASQKFDLITFNDVLEHLPDVTKAVKACHEHLNPSGFLAITIPNSDGIFYRLANLISKIGVALPLERLWQKNFHSPHVSYFNDQNLRSLVQKQGFDRIHQRSLPSLRLAGLWQRLRMDSTLNVALAVPLWIGIVILSPLIKILRSDITFHLYERKAKEL